MKKIYLRIKGGCVQELLSRKQVMSLWEGNDHNDEPCCPYCRDILSPREDGNFYCDNAMCKNADVYEKDAKRIKV